MRASGILLPVFSLPGEYGIGCFSKEAYRFVDWLEKSGQSYWQILPLGPVGYGASPYQSDSTFAGNPCFISLEDLFEEGLITRQELEGQKRPQDIDYADYEALKETREPVLRAAYARFQGGEEFDSFCEKNEEWLKDYTRFKVLKELYNGAAWDSWERPHRLRHKAAMEKLDAKYGEEMRYYKFIEYIIDKQWKKLKSYANEKGIQIIGDLPIYVSMDSADAWSNTKLFKFDRELKPKCVAGCPPDYFCQDGQLWGNPVYDWKVHEKDNFSWWIRRMKHCFDIYDVLRLDHFRGFASYYEVDYGAEHARDGKWVKGPGMKFFNRIKEVLGEVPIIAEDLGFLTQDVFDLLEESGYPGMKVLSFAFDDSHDSLYLPHKYQHNCVVYTGTHDNDTLVGWIEKMGPSERKFVSDYVGHYNVSNEDLAFEVVRLAMGSTADLAVIPMQDYIGLGSYARINTPATVGNNWKWRMREECLSDYLAGKIEWLTDLFGRRCKKDD